MHVMLPTGLSPGLKYALPGAGTLRTLVGLRRKDTPCLTEPDRVLAIKRAIEEARPGGTIILAGKGHETYQVLKDRTIDFDDRAVAREVLKGYGYHKDH